MNAEHGEENVQVKPHAYVHRKKTLQGADTYLIQIEYPIISDDHIFFQWDNPVPVEMETISNPTQITKILNIRPYWTPNPDPVH